MYPRQKPPLLPISPPPSYSGSVNCDVSCSRPKSKKRQVKSWLTIVVLILFTIWLVALSFDIYAEYIRDNRTTEQKERDLLDLERDRQDAERERWSFERDQEAHRKEVEKLKYRQSPMYWESPTRGKCVQYATRKCLWINECQCLGIKLTLTQANTHLAYGVFPQMLTGLKLASISPLPSTIKQSMNQTGVKIMFAVPVVISIVAIMLNRLVLYPGIRGRNERLLVDWLRRASVYTFLG